jgi:xanthine dehydrogenase YagT iron-sulfur-binding subunit
MILTVNGSTHEAPTDVRLSLLDVLREHLALPGSKLGCNQGACGACTVLIDGDRVLSCLTLAVQCEGRDVTTIEGVGSSVSLHPLQNAFIEHDGLQCGYCTPGQVCSAIGMAEEARCGVPSAVTDSMTNEVIHLTDAEIRERMSGNLCRCGSYNGIVDAIRETFVEDAAR